MAKKVLNRIIILSPNSINSEEILKQIREAQTQGGGIIINIEKTESLLAEDLTKEIVLYNLSIKNNLEDEKKTNFKKSSSILFNIY